MVAGLAKRVLLWCSAVLCLVAGEVSAEPARSLQLDNGLRVFLKAVESGAPKLDMRLIVHMGAEHERQGEQGWAHLVEHMAFSGSDRLSQAELRDLFAQSNLGIGPDINAVTGDQFTAYKLSVAAAELQLVQQNLRLLADWLSAMRFSADDLAREKRVIAAEALDGPDTLEQLQDRRAAGTPVAAPVSVMGVMADVRAAEPEALAAFWRRGYRPDNAALLITGDMDPVQMEQRVRAVFSALAVEGAGPAAVLPRPNTRPVEEATAVVLDQGGPHKVAVSHWSESARHSEDVLLALTAVQWRLGQSGDSSLCSAAQHHAVVFSATQELHYLARVAVRSRELQCLSAMTAAIIQLSEDGIDAAEALSFIDFIRGQHQRALVEEINISSSAVADVLQRHVIKGADPLSRADRLQSLLGWVSTLNLPDMNAVFDRELSPEAISLVVQGRGKAVPNAEQLQSVWRSASLPLAGSSVPEHYRLAETERQPAVETQWNSDRQLSLKYANGARVQLLKTKNVKNHFDVMLVREGGLSALPVGLQAAAEQLPQLLPSRGLSAASALSVASGLRQHKLGLSWFVERYRHGMRGSARGAGAEALFSMLHQAQQPLQSAAWAEVVGETDDVFLVGQRQLQSAIQRALYGGAEGGGVNAGVELQSFAGAQRALYQGGGGLVLYVGGDFDWRKMRELADKYIGSLPAGAPAAVPAVSATPKRQRLVHHGNRANRADLYFYYVQSTDNGIEREDAKFLLLREVLAQRLWRVLREQEGLAYGFELQLQRRLFARGGSSLRVNTVCEPQHIERVQAGVDAVLLSVLTSEVAAAELDQARRRVAPAYREKLADNGSLLDEWASLQQRGLGAAELALVASQVEQLTASELQHFAQWFFKSSGFLQISVVPGLQQLDSAKKLGAFAR